MRLKNANYEKGLNFDILNQNDEIKSQNYKTSLKCDLLNQYY